MYCRVSDKVQVRGSSLAFQEQACKEFAHHNNYEIVQTFIEKGQSARTDDRTELIKLIAFCKLKSNAVKAVIFHKVDRWARQSLDYHQLRKELKDHDIAIISATEPLEDTPAGRFMENMLASQAQFDNEVRIERCKNGMKDAVAEGRFIWTAPVGYSNSRTGKNSNLIPNDKAVMIRMAFEEVAQNTAPVEFIRQKLTKEGLTNSKGVPITRPDFYRILRNEIYAGWIVVFGQRTKGTFEPIITEALFQQVQQVLNKSKIPKLIYKKDREDLPLRRFIQHPSGYSLSGHEIQGRNKKYTYYRLRNPNRMYPVTEIEQLFQQLLNNFELTDSYFVRLTYMVKKNLAARNTAQLQVRKETERHIQTLQLKQDILIQKNIDGVISNDILKSQLEHIEEELIKARASIINTPVENLRYDLLMNTVSQYLKNPYRIWVKAPLADKLRLQWFTFPKGLLFDGEILQTTEICNLFKGKSGNFEDLSRVVYHSSQKVNRIQNKPYMPMSDLPDKASLIRQPRHKRDATYWNTIGAELIQLADILKEIKESKNYDQIEK